MKAAYSSRRALLNGGMSALQVVVISFVLLVSYRFAVGSAGQESFGLYSLFFAFGTLTQLGSLGFGTGAARHLAQAWGEGRLDDIRPLIYTSLGVCLGGAVVVTVPLYFAMGLYSDKFLAPELADVADQLRKVVLAGACLVPVSTAAQALMDGASRSYVRSPVVILASAVYLGSVFLWLPTQGIVALAYAAILQQVVVIVVLLGILLAVTDRPSVRRRGGPRNARAVLRYNLKFHALTVPTLAYEPVVKAMLDAFAGLSAIAFYEIANRLLQQINALVLAANQAIVPLVAVRASTGRLDPAVAFKRTFAVVFPLTIASFGGALICLPLVERFVFGGENSAVVGFGLLLVVGWVGNCLCGPAYFMGVTLDNFRANIVASYSILVVIALLGLVLGHAFGGYGLAAAVSLAYLTGASLVNAHFIRRSGLSMRDVFTRDQLWPTAATAALVAIALVAGLGSSLGQSVVVTVSSLGCLTLLWLVVASRHPARTAWSARTGHDVSE